MDREDRRRYFVIGSVIVEIVQPILRTKLENEYTIRGYATFQDFLGSQPVLHTLYHLRHKGTRCCTDAANCPRNRSSLPLNYYQWDLLYAENPGPANHHCHCRFSARTVQLDDLDISLSSLILLNCFSFSNIDNRAIDNLRTLKNNYLSHNTKGSIEEHEYGTIWTDLTMHIHQLDNTKQDDLVRVQQRPLDADICHKYNAELLGMHQKLDEIGSSINGLEDTLTSVDAHVREMKEDVKGLLHSVSSLLIHGFQQRSIKTEIGEGNLLATDEARHYHIGQEMFIPHHETVLFSEEMVHVSGIVMMDDGRVVVCIDNEDELVIYDPDNSQSKIINLTETPWGITAVNTYTVAILCKNKDIILFNIYSNLMQQPFRILESISLPYASITMAGNNLVVPGNEKLLIVDYHTKKTVRTIHTDVQPWRLHGADEKIYFNSSIYHNNIYCYSVAGEKLFTITLPSRLWDITSLKDASLYVAGYDGSITHVSSDGKQFKTIDIGSKENTQINRQRKFPCLSYNHKQNKLSCVLQIYGCLSVYHER